MTENVMICAICGQCRYPRDLLPAAPTLPDLKRHFAWTEAFGAEAMQRLEFFPNPHVCIKHHGAEKQASRWDRPRSIPEKERRLIDNFLHDHCSFLLPDQPQHTTPSWETYYCSLCSAKVKIEEMTAHAELHSPKVIHLNDYLCYHHYQNPLPADRTPVSSCSNCTHLMAKAVLGSARVQAKRCFPMFEFTIRETQENGMKIYSMECQFKFSYNRDYYPRMASSVPSTSSEFMMDEVKMEYSEDVKLEPIEEYDVQGTSDGFVEEGVKYEEEKKEEGGGEEKLTMEQIYEMDKHPSFTTMIGLMERIEICSFKLIFQFYENKRRFEGIECPPEGDNCTLAREYIAMESLPESDVEVGAETLRQLQNEFAKHYWTNNKYFKEGYSYVIAKMFELPVNFVRRQYTIYCRSYPQRMKKKNATNSNYLFTPKNRLYDKGVRAYLKAHLAEQPYPSIQEYQELARNTKLTVTQVRRFYQTQRSQMRKTGALGTVGTPGNHKGRNESHESVFVETAGVESEAERVEDDIAFPVE